MNIYVTGMGMISAIGTNVEESLQNLFLAKSGIGDIRHLQTRHRDDYVAGEVNLSNAELAQKAPETDAVLTRTTTLGLWAVTEALRQANVQRSDVAAGIRTGFISASTVGGMGRTERYYQDFLDHKTTENFLPTHDGADSTEWISSYLGIKDFVTTINTACASSANAIVLAVRMLKSKRLDRVIVGGTDALCRFTFNGFNSLMLLDKEPCRPFDENRRGINLGEGAAYLVLESEELVQKQGKTPLARISGYGVTNDAYHPTASSPLGEGLQASMRGAFATSGLAPASIDYINAHGTGTPNNDLTEGWALRHVFDGHVPAFSSTKAFTGHTLGAAGAIEAVISVLALRHNVLIPNLHFEESIRDHALVPVTHVEQGYDMQHVLSNASGMGGSCSSIIFSKN